METIDLRELARGAELFGACEESSDPIGFRPGRGDIAGIGVEFVDLTLSW